MYIDGDTHNDVVDGIQRDLIGVGCTLGDVRQNTGTIAVYHTCSVPLGCFIGRHHVILDSIHHHCLVVSAQLYHLVGNSQFNVPILGRELHTAVQRCLGNGSGRSFFRHTHVTGYTDSCAENPITLHGCFGNLCEEGVCFHVQHVIQIGKVNFLRNLLNGNHILCYIRHFYYSPS